MNQGSLSGNRFTLLTLMATAIALAAGRAAAASAPGGNDGAGDGAGWLQWERGDGAGACASAAEFATAVTAELRSPPDDAAARSHRRLSVTLRREPGAPARWAAELRLTGDDGATIGTRSLDRAGDSCAPLTDALALMAALLLADTGDDLGREAGDGPHAANAPPAPAAAVAPSGPDLAGHPAPAATRAPPGAGARSGWTVSGEAGPIAGMGLLPGVAFAVEARLGVAPPSGPALFVSGNLWRTGTASVGPDSAADAGAHLDLWTVGLGLCPVRSRSGARLAAVGCLSGEAGRLHAAGFGLDPAVTRDRWAVDVALGGELRLRLGSTSFVALGLRAVVPLVRDRLVYRTPGGQTGTLFQMWPVAAITGVRVGLGLP